MTSTSEPELTRLARRSAYAALTMAGVCGACVLPLLLLGLVGLPTVWLELSAALQSVRWLPLSSVVALCASVLGLGAAALMGVGGVACAALGTQTLRSASAAEREALLLRASQEARDAAWKRTSPLRESTQAPLDEAPVRARVALDPEPSCRGALDTMTPAPGRITGPFATLERKSPITNH